MTAVCATVFDPLNCLVAQAVMIPHYSLIANIIQHAAYVKVGDRSIPTEKKIFRPGGVVLGGTC